MNELSSLRTETGKTFELDPKLKAGQYCLEARTGPIHYKEAYKDGEPWLDLDETYSEPSEIKGIGKVLVYPKLPNIVTVFQDRCGYQIQSRSNPDHIARVELVSIDGQEITAWQDASALKTYARVHPYRVGIWKDFSAASKAKSTTIRWKITEQGNPDKDSHPFFFRECPEAYTTADLTDLSPAALDAAKATIETARTRIDDTSWHWDEIIPAAAKLVDTDWQVGASGNDGHWYGAGLFVNDGTNIAFGNAYGASYRLFIRFTSVTISKQSTINSAIVSLYALVDLTGTTCNANLYLNNSDNAVAPTSYATAEALSLTSAVSWNAVAAWVKDTWYNSPSLVTPLQTVINRSGWSSGNAIMPVFKDNVSSADARRTAYSYDSSPSYAPKLTVTWTDPPRPRGIFVPNVSWLSKSLLKRREI